MPPARITVVGLGPGSPDLLTLEARDILRSAPAVWARTLRHPTLATFERPGALHGFDDLYDSLPTFDGVYEAIVGRLLEMAGGGDIVYAVPGHPLVGEATVRRLMREARDHSVEVKIVAGLSFLEPVVTALGVDPLEAGLQVVDALQPRVSPDRPALFAQVYDRRVASSLKLALLETYPADHRVVVVTAAGTAESRTRACELAALDRDDRFDHLSSVFVPGLDLVHNIRTFDGFRAIVARLRAPGGCPWDRTQTHASLRKYLLEETYEALDALDQGDLPALEEELGDILLQVFLQSQIAEDEGNFTADDVVHSIAAKIIRRHPHVFGDVTVESAEEVVQNWQALKDRERSGDGETPGVLDSVPGALPALALAQTLQSRAAGVGFDWPDMTGVLEKVAEEVGEFQSAEGDARRDEFGDILFALVNYARHAGIDAEETLRLSAGRFRARFARVETLARAQATDVRSLDLAALDALWEEAKADLAAGR